MNVEIQLPGVRVGLVEADGVVVEPSGSQLMQEMNALCADLRRKFTIESLAESEAILSVRKMFRCWGVDPSKYRPSSEALLRRVVQGKGLFSVSNVVDLSNLGSVETGWPFGIYNHARISPPAALRLGAGDERYEGIGRRVWHLGGRPVLADLLGPFGSPISDSTRTQITEGVSEILAVIYAPDSASGEAIDEAVKKQAQRLSSFARATETRTQVTC